MNFNLEPVCKRPRANCVGDVFSMDKEGTTMR